MIRRHTLLVLLAFCTSQIQAWSNLFQKQQSRINNNDVLSKQTLLDNLEDPLGFNKATKDRTVLVQELVKDNPTPSPGSTKSFLPLAVGTWQIVYAPHIYAARSFGAQFDPVRYILRPDQTMTSHAKYNNVPFLGSGWLSVSGTYSSQDEDGVCRVDFDKAWIKPIQDSDDAEPYDSLESVPDGIVKDTIQRLGRLFFVDSVSVFPVSYLDRDTIVFDFELLKTRICARKVGSAS